MLQILIAPTNIPTNVYPFCLICVMLSIDSFDLIIIFVSYQVADDTIQINNIPVRDYVSYQLQTATLELVALLVYHEKENS